jgi:recombination protein RecR
VRPDRSAFRPACWDDRNVKTLESLIGYFSKLPGLGRKSATRIVYHLLKADPLLVQNLAAGLARLKESVRHCSVCGTYTEGDPCDICADARRDRRTVCVVEQAQDVAVIEGTGEYRGLYHVLMGAISPLDGIGPENLNIGRLIARIQKDGIAEVILATNPTVEGDTTALYLARLLEHREVKLTRLALGLPVGGDLEYADRITLARALRGRTGV